MKGTVTRVSQKNGTGSNGDWTKIGFQVDEKDVWYGYFLGRGAPKVNKGDTIEFDAVKKGKFHNAENIEVLGSSKVAKEGNGYSYDEDKEYGTTLSYVKDVQVAMINNRFYDPKTFNEDAFFLNMVILTKKMISARRVGPPKVEPPKEEDKAPF